MLTLRFLKVWGIAFFALAYGFTYAFFPEVIPWNTPKHLYVILNIILTISSITLGAMILSYLSEDMMGRSDSFKLFGEKNIWCIWYLIGLPMVIYGLYKWEHPGIIIASIIFYFGMKCLIKNQNKHYAAYKQEQIVRRARQEKVEKVTL